jgi:hypothetical protein
VLEEVALEPTTLEACFEGEAGCTTCFSAVGTPVAGTFTAGLETGTCDATYATASGTTTYTVTNGYDGSWSTGATAVLVELTGSRTSTLQGPRGRTQGEPAVLTIDQAGLTLDLTGIVTGYTVSGDYLDAAGRTTTLDLVEDNGVLTGTLTATHATCTIGGTRTAPSVVCER